MSPVWDQRLRSKAAAGRQAVRGFTTLPHQGLATPTAAVAGWQPRQRARFPPRVVSSAHCQAPSQNEATEKGDCSE